MKIAGPLLVIGGIVITLVGVQERATAAKLASEGKTVGVTVVAHRLIWGSRGAKTTYKLDTRYSPEGSDATVQQSFNVPGLLYARATNGGKLKVRYLPSSPETAELVGAERSGYEQLGIGAVMAVIGLGLCVFAFRPGG